MVMETPDTSTTPRVGPSDQSKQSEGKRNKNPKPKEFEPPEPYKHKEGSD
jgi:hypothetical protein